VEGRPADAEVEVAGHREVVRELRILEVTHARRLHARGGEPVVEPGGGAAAEVRADRVMDRREHLEQHEHDAHEAEGPGQRLAALDGAHQRAHRHREARRQQPAQREEGPPGDREGAVGPGEDAGELPLAPRAQARDHGGGVHGAAPSSRG
jgi:hypothetical protein